MLYVLVIAQHQRMTHTASIAGFGTAETCARALGVTDDGRKLREATTDIDRGGCYRTTLAESSINLEAGGA